MECARAFARLLAISMTIDSKLASDNAAGVINIFVVGCAMDCNATPLPPGRAAATATATAPRINVRLSIEILPHEFNDIANWLQHPLEMVFTNEALIDADNRCFFALWVRTNIGKGVFRSNLLTHRYTLRNADNQILVTAGRRNRGCLRGKSDKMRPGESQYPLRCPLRLRYQNHSCRSNTNV